MRSAEQTLSTGKPPLRLPLALAYLIVILILLTPFLLAALGAYIVWISFPAILGTGLGLGVIALSWILLPRRARMPKDSLGRSELPALFALLDRISDAIKAPRTDIVCLTDDYNAYAKTVRPFVGRKTRVLGLGLTLWETLDNQQKIALLAHEIGHFASSDPERGTILHYGKETLVGWSRLLRPDVIRNPYSRRELSDLLASAACDGIVFLLECIWTVLHWTTMFHSQVAEYLADAQSAAVAGRVAVMKTLDALILAPETDRAVLGIGIESRPEGGWIFDHIATEVRSTPPHRADAYRKAAEQERASRRFSHPPTLSRQAFLDRLQLAEPKIVLDQASADAIRAELGQHKERLGAQLVRKIKLRQLPRQ